MEEVSHRDEMDRKWKKMEGQGGDGRSSNQDKMDRKWKKIQYTTDGRWRIWKKNHETRRNSTSDGLQLLLR